MDTTTLETTKKDTAATTTAPKTTTPAATTTSASTTTTAPATTTAGATVTTGTKKKKIKKSAQIRKVGYFIHYVPDMAKGIEFFKSIGLKLKFESPEWTEFKAGIKFALHASDCAAKACSSEKKEKRFTGITFTSKNLDKTYAAFQAQGIELMGEPKQVCEEGRSFEFADPFGAVFSIYGA